MISIIPANATIETNANGTAYKFDNGFMICVKKVDEQLECSSAWGSLYSSTTEINFGSWPVPFIETPTVSVTATQSSGNWMDGFFGIIQHISTTAAGKTSFLRPTTKTGNVRADIIAVGKWK